MRIWLKSVNMNLTASALLRTTPANMTLVAEENNKIKIICDDTLTVWIQCIPILVLICSIIHTKPYPSQKKRKHHAKFFILISDILTMARHISAGACILYISQLTWYKGYHINLRSALYFILFHDTDTDGRLQITVATCSV